GAAPVLGFVVAPQVNIVSAGVGSQLVAHPEHQVPVPPPVDLVAELYNPQVLRPARVPAAHVAGCFGVTPRMAFDSEGGEEQAVVAVDVSYDSGSGGLSVILGAHVFYGPLCADRGNCAAPWT